VPPAHQRWNARLCSERPLSAGEAQLALAALGALAGLARHGLDREVRVLEKWLESRRD
jgi:hypothetical protein